MKDIKELLKKDSSIFDAERLFNDGKLDEKALSVLIKEKPILPQPRSFDRQKFLSIKENRDRLDKFPMQLPTNGLLPFIVDAHEMIGEYENKHNLYLTTACAYNNAMEYIKKLEERIEKLEKRK